ncbi:uncharacterized protein PAC_12116 [Phialocephala subalpina]|uniref:Transglycosylase SLT domain-containing protein n=1 Tax=Phialocephala subalpina TaxID=576137 RepID=A0A1L7XB26_9HELO|nr:uncharacterized protein PAC_12116 [Phialocephala subalpina]
MGWTHYSGPASAFPPMSTWKTFEQIFNANQSEMLQTGDTHEDVGRIWNAVEAAAKEIGVEERVIFCIIMQESTGNVGIGTTTDPGGKATGGLMQAEESPAFPGKHGLSQAQISAMVTAGTKHFKGNLKQLDDKDTASTIYRALRLYNSGKINESNLSDGEKATPSYVSDIANRLQGRTNKDKGRDEL